MKLARLALTLSPLSGLLLSCATFPAELGEDVMQVPADGRIEVSLTPGGGVAEVELHVRPEALPQAIQDAMATHLASMSEAEIEYIDGVRFYEASGKTRDGREMEVLLRADGEVYELEIVRTESETPAAIVTAAKGWRGPGTVTSWEEIQDGARRTVSWHVKKTVDDFRFKLIFDPDGRMERVYRETPAEIEVVVE
ncbi:MAG: hypothetical protein EYC70_01315 [Planctomycetota bacterium]|nr:MAG: hypothetical protein EYC70_01315 [Planctomycetota bacterium]